MRTRIRDFESTELIVPDLVKLLAHPEYSGESLSTLERMAPEIEAYLHKNAIQPGFDQDLDRLRQIRPEMEAGVEAADHIGINRQKEAHLAAFNLQIPNELRLAIEQALKMWIFDVLGVYVQVWNSDILGDGFRRETLRITRVAVPSEGLRFLAKLTANNDKLPRRSVAPWVHIKGLDPYLVCPFDIGTLCGDDAIQVAVHKWD